MAGFWTLNADLKSIVKIANHWNASEGLTIETPKAVCTARDTFAFFITEIAIIWTLLAGYPFDSIY